MSYLANLVFTLSKRNVSGKITKLWNDVDDEIVESAKSELISESEFCLVPLNSKKILRPDIWKPRGTKSKPP